jgi:hypothetical protein
VIGNDKGTNIMKKIFTLTLAALGLLTLPQARAWTYSDGDVLLVFRDGNKDVEFDLGNISQFTGHPSGYTVAVTNWSLNLVTSTFGSDLTVNGAAVTVVVVAKSSGASTAWLSSPEPNTTAYRPSASSQGTVSSIINNLGLYPPIYAVPTNSVPRSYVIGATAAKYKYASYDYIVSGGTYNVGSLGGNASFPVEQNIPGSLDFWAIQTYSSSAALQPDSLVGTFNITANGVLTFVAGPRSSTITGVGRVGNVSAVSFTTTIGNTYGVAYTNQLGGAVSTWPVDATTLVGDGYAHTLNHTNSGSVEFYRILTQ